MICIRLSLASAIAWLLLSPVFSSTALAAESQCKHNNPNVNVECRPRVPNPWVYGAEGIIPPVGGMSTFSEALTLAFERVPNSYYNFCSYDYRINSPPWVVTISDPDFSRGEKKTNYVSGWVDAGDYCADTLAQKITVTRARSIACPNGWMQGYDGLGSLHCTRAEQSPPPRCEPPCDPGVPKKGGVGTGEFGYMGNPIFVHNGDKSQTELD